MTPKVNVRRSVATVTTVRGGKKLPTVGIKQIMRLVFFSDPSSVLLFLLPSCKLVDAYFHSLIPGLKSTSYASASFGTVVLVVFSLLCSAMMDTILPFQQQRPNPSRPCIPTNEQPVALIQTSLRLLQMSSINLHSFPSDTHTIVDVTKTAASGGPPTRPLPTPCAPIATMQPQPYHALVQATSDCDKATATARRHQGDNGNGNTAS
ncbi:hypothetical protein EDB85DRAFT_1898987 [Lactarius pseudohatsudake]|nr:hypothetical protein EDB85DRAFT_1898987 [Lactarius pseudohatsudake]